MALIRREFRRAGRLRSAAASGGASSAASSALIEVRSLSVEQAPPQAKMNQTEHLWLDYARDVLKHGGGAMNCCVCGDTDRISRWPGYLGPDYASGRVLLVGAVHNQADMDATPEVSAIGAAALEWINGDRSDSAYLALLRAEYPKAIDFWCRHGGGVFRKFAEIRAALGSSLEQCAVSNIAKCTAVRGSKKYCESINACPVRFPVTDLIARLDPVIVFIACNDTNARIPGVVQATATRRVYRFHQLNSLEYATKRRRDVWLPEAVDFYRAAMKRLTAAI
jgi:hypothetical protein